MIYFSWKYGIVRMCVVVYLCVPAVLSYAMQQPERALHVRDSKQIELAVFKKFFLPAEVREFFALAEAGDKHPFPRTLLVHAPYSMRPSFIARAVAEQYGAAARYEKFHSWYPTVCADIQKTVTARLEQDAQAPIIVYINDLARAGRDLSGKKQPGCAGVVENMARFLQRYFGREGEWKNSPVLLIVSTTDCQILSDQIKNIFEKSVQLSLPSAETRKAMLCDFLHEAHKVVQPGALNALAELTEGASFEELRKWSEALTKRALLVPTAVVSVELVENAREHVQPVIDTDRADEKKLREWLVGLDEQHRESPVANKPRVLQDLVPELIPSVVTTLVQKITAEADTCPIKLVLFSGPRGVGKYTVAQACAGTLGAPVHELSLKELFNPNSFVQENGMLTSVREWQKKVPAGKKGVVLIQDIDNATQVAGSLNSVDRGLLELRKKCLKEVLHAIQTSEQLIGFATTADSASVDPDIRNAFYCQVPVPLPDEAGRAALLHQVCASQAASSVDIATIAVRTNRFSCQNLIDLVGHATVHAYLESQPVATVHMQKALAEIVAEEKGSGTPLGMYQ